jgi:betaine-aldehyde dehydrogenase
MQNLNYINGQWRDSQGGATLPVVDPATEEVFAHIPQGTAQDIDDAVAAGLAALNDGWRNTTGGQRAVLLRAIARAIESRSEELAQLEVRDCGKPITEARYDMGDAAACFDYYADLATGLDAKQGTPVDISDPRFSVKLRYEAAGVVGLIVPWNFPMVNAAWKIAPALAAGCSVVIKPSELASLTTLRLAAIAEEAGVPAGVLNVVTGLGSEAGARLAGHPGIAKVSFTGGVESGRRVMQARADLVGDVALELGGKSALVLFDDVNLDHAIEWILMGSLWNGGQVCAATSRVLVQRSIYQTLVEKLRHAIQAVKVGPGSADSTQVGPLISAAQVQRVSSLVSQGIEQGATLLCGGERPSGFTTGYFYSPTVLLDVARDNVLWRDEIFGPVLSVTPFDDEQHAIELANDSHFGLAAAVLSDDANRRDRVAAQLVAGIVWANCSGPAFIQAPWGGVKQSGFGRGLGEWGMHEFLELKQVTTYNSAEAWGHFIN